MQVAYRAHMNSSIPVQVPVPTALTSDANEDSSGGDDSSSDPDDVDTDESCDNWRFLQVCGVAHDVCTSLGLAFPLQVEQAVQFVASTRLPAEDNSHLVDIANLFLQGLYRPQDVLIPVLRAKMVYVCAIAMTYLYQPTPDSRMLQEFHMYIGAFRQSMGIDASYDRIHCQLLVMQYIKFAYNCPELYHSRHSVLHDYGSWFNGARQTFITGNGPRSTIPSSIIADNFLEYSGSLPRSLESRCYDYIRPFQTPIDCPVPASSADFAMFCTHQADFYQRLVNDLDILTLFLHRRYFCCVSICRDSQNTFRYMVALSRLDDIITILVWIVSEYVMKQMNGISHVRRVCMARYDQYPYEHLLARAYNLRFMQSHEHPSSSPVHVLYGYGILPCCRHNHRQSYDRDLVLHEHWYNRNVPLPSPLFTQLDSVPAYESNHIPLTSADYRHLVQNGPWYRAQMSEVIRSLSEVITQFDPLYVQAQLLVIMTEVLIRCNCLVLPSFEI